MNTAFTVLVILVPFMMVGFILWGVNKKRREMRGARKKKNKQKKIEIIELCCCAFTLCGR